MASAANSQAYGPGGPAGSPWGSGPTRGPHWQNGPHRGPPWPWHYVPRPFAIAAMVLGFMVWWPIGLALLFYNIGSGSMGCRSFRRRGYDATGPAQGHAWGNGPWANWKSWCQAERPAPTSGNRAFDEYRAETLRRLEEEQQEFSSFLERLRFAKDKSEFDQFMAERRQPPTPSPEAPDAA
jgi:hypothetical protein